MLAFLITIIFLMIFSTIAVLDRFELLFEYYLQHRPPLPPIQHSSTSMDNITISLSKVVKTAEEQTAELPLYQLLYKKLQRQNLSIE